MPDRDPTCIGKVRHVLGSTVTVALNCDLAGVAPIYKGHLLPIGQIGSLVRIPQGIIDLVGSVSLVGIAELSGAPVPSDSVQRDERWLQVQLLGEIDRASGKFHRGVSTYPGLDDSVHFATPFDLRTIFPQPGPEHLQLGYLAASDEVPLCLDAAKLVTRHAAIVGSTGSGKTSAVASILQRFLSGGWTAANIVVIDPHGEYSAALGESAAIRSVLGDEGNRLRVPFWALPAQEISRIFTGGLGSATFSSRFNEYVANARKKFVSDATWLNLDPTSVTADTPVPFDIREVWYKLDSENRETRNTAADETSVAILQEGDAQQLQSKQFSPYAQGNRAPFKGPFYGVYGMSPDLLRLGLLNPQLRFFLEPQGTVQGPDPLLEVIPEWLGNTSPVSVLDFSGVPALAADLAIGVILNLLFELCLRSEKGGAGIGRASPVLVVLEESHRYLGATATPLTRDSANRIAREGRKYGVGIMLVTQRPTELPDTALAQCGTLVALRLSNTADQGTIKAALPDTVAGLASVLPSLRTGEAIVSGEALVMPARAVLTLPKPRPKADDPTLDPWRVATKNLDLQQSIQQWRGTYEETDV